MTEADPALVSHTFSQRDTKPWVHFALPGGTIVPGVNADGSINTSSGPTGLVTQTPHVAQGNPGVGGGGPRVIQLTLRPLF